MLGAESELLKVRLAVWGMLHDENSCIVSQL